MSAAAAPAPVALAGTVLDWATGARLSTELETIAATGQTAAERAAWLERKLNVAKHVPRGELDGLLSHMFMPPDKRAEVGRRPLETVEMPSAWAAVVEPLRAAGAAVLAAVSVVGETPNVRARIVAAAPREVLADEVTAIVPVDAAWLCAQADACAAAVASAEDLCSELSAVYDDMDFTPSRIDRRLRALQLTAPPGVSGASATELEYAALFEPARQFRQGLREALSHALSAGDAAASILSMAGSARLGRAVLLLRTAASDAAAPHERRHALLTLMDVVARAADGSILMQAAVDVHTALAVLSTSADDEALVAGACAALSRASSVDDDDNAAKQAVADAGGVELLMAAVQRHAASEHVVAHACAMLGNLAWVTTACPAIAAAGGVGPILAALTRHTSGTVAQAAGHVLANLSGGGLADAMRAAGGVAVLVQAMRTHAADVIVVRKAVQALANMTAEGRLGDVLEVGTVRVIVKALTTHLADPEVAEQGCMLLGHLHTATAVVHVPRELTVAAVLALRLHRDNATIAGIACSVIATASAHDPKRCAVIAATGGLGTIVDALVANPGEVRLGAPACQALSNLTNAPHHDKMLSADQVRAVVAVIASFASDLEATSCGCAALANVAAHAPSRAAILGADGVKLFVQALHRHCNAGILQDVCRGLASMTQQPGATEQLLAEGGIGVVLDAMTAHAGDLAAVDSACNLLGILSTTSLACIKALADAGTVPRVAQVTAAHVGNRRVAVRALMMLTKLGEAEVSMNALANSAGIAFLVHAIKAHPAEAAVVWCGLLLLCSVCHSPERVGPELSDTVVAHGGASVAAAALKVTPEPRVAAVASGLLEHLTCESAEGVLGAGALQACVAALRRHGDEVEVVVSCCNVLSTYAFDDRGRAALVAAGGVAAMCRAVTAHPQLTKLLLDALLALHDCATSEPAIAAALASLPAAVRATLTRA